MWVPCLANFILLDLIVSTMFSEQNKLWSSSLCNLPRPSVTSSFIDSALCSETPSICVPFSVWKTKFHSPTGRENYSSVKTCFYLNVTLTFLDRKRKNKMFSTKFGMPSPRWICSSLHQKYHLHLDCFSQVLKLCHISEGFFMVLSCILLMRLGHLICFQYLQHMLIY